MISVIIPTKNRINSLKILVNSIINQTLFPNEIIIVDQSEVNYQKEIEEWFIEKSVTLHYIHNPNITGLTQAKNTGVNFAHGDLIFFFDDDLELFPDFIEKMNKKMDQYPTLYGLCGKQYLKKEKKQLYYYIRNITRRGAFKVDLPNKYNKKYSGIILARKISGGITVYRKEIFEKYRFDENLVKYSLGEDYDFSYRVSQEHEIGKFNEAVAYHYHDTSGRLDQKRMFEAKICFFHYFYHKNIKNTKLRFKKLSYIWLILGIILHALIICIKKLNLDPLIGIYNSIKKTHNNYKGSDCIKIKKQKIRILQVFGSLNRGGAETMMMNLYRNIDKEKFEFSFLCCTEKEHSDYEEEIAKIGGKIYKVLPPSRVGYIKHYKDLMKIMTENGRFDIIHIHTLLHAGIVSIVAKKAKIRTIIVHSHSTNSGRKNNIITKSYEKISKFLIVKNANYYFACSEQAGGYLFGKDNVKNGKVTIINNGILLNKFMNLDKKETNLSENSVIIGNVARFTKEKNHIFFIDLAKELVRKKIDFKIVLIGTGPLKKEIESKIEKEGLESYFNILGKREDIPELMSMMDIFVLPSIYEGIPVVLIEAQASGLPCLVSKNIDVSVDLELGLMHFLDINKTEEWSETIQNKKFSKLANKQEIREKIEQKGYDAVLNAKQLEKMYNKFYIVGET